MKEVAGGLWLGSFVAGALLGLVPGLIMFMLGVVVAGCELGRELRAEKRAASWRKNYPSYKY